MAGTQNLRPVRTSEEAKERGRIGGIKSGEARRKKKLLKEELDILLQKQTETGKTYQELISTALVKKALEGNIKAFTTIRDTIEQIEEPDENSNENNLKNDEKEIQKEYESIKETYKDNGEEYLKKYDTLFKRMAFMTVALAKMEEIINRDGMVMQGKNGNGFTTYIENPIQKTYNTMLKNYQGIWNKLNGNRETEINQSSGDEFDEF